MAKKNNRVSKKSTSVARRKTAPPKLGVQITDVENGKVTSFWSLNDLIGMHPESSWELAVGELLRAYKTVADLQPTVTRVVMTF